ncbi:MAG: outer membrane beta-barrel protein, partial [Chitinivibrionales bacterium]|nr:outer membrane beta-barrel protein [Chitinivibrionales bacterium]
MKCAHVRAGIVSVALISLLSFPAAAQQSWKSGLSYELGAKGGVIFSNFTGDGVDVLEDGMRDGFTVLSDDPQVFIIGGITGTMNFGRYFALQPEILYQRSGKAYEGVLLGQEQEFSFHIDYLTIPVLLKLVFPTNERFRTNFFVGPHLSIKLNATLDDIDQFPPRGTVDLGPLDEFGRDEDIDEETSGVDAGITVGVALD